MTKQGLLTKAERTALEKLLQESSFKGKKRLKHLLWLNSTKPKYKLGDCFKVSDPSLRIFGVQANNINAKVVEVFTFADEDEYRYKLEAHVVNHDGRETVSTMFLNERFLRVKAKDNENRIAGNGEHEEEIAVWL